MQEWSDAELDLLKKGWGRMPPDDIAAMIYCRFGTVRTEKSVRVQASRQGLSTAPRLTPEDEDLIVQLLSERQKAEQVARNLSDEAVAEKFEVPTSVVTRIRRSMRDEEE